MYSKFPLFRVPSGPINSDLYRELVLIAMQKEWKLDV